MAPRAKSLSFVSSEFVRYRSFRYQFHFQHLADLRLLSRSDKAGARMRGKIVFIANCRLRDKTRDHSGLHTRARCRPNRPTDESERTRENKIELIINLDGE